MVIDKEVEEPTVLTLVLTAIGLALLLSLCIAGIVFLPSFGYIWWIFSAVAGILAWLVLGLFRKSKLDSRSLTSRQRWFRRIVGWMRMLFIGVFAFWLGLIVWFVSCPSGPAPAPKSSPTMLRVVTWNIHCGQDNGPPWKQFNWAVRKRALHAALDQIGPDILCVQEATPEQVAFLEEVLSSHRRVGVGRDGQSGGEHCAIYFNRQRFEEIGGNTFWLEEPIDQPRAGSALDVKRICTWVRLRDRDSDRTVRVYNTHLYLTESQRLSAVKLILAHIAAGDRADAIVLTADFNAIPSVPSRRLFTEAGLVDSAERAGKPAGKATFQLYGIGLSCLDGILVDSHWRVASHLILDLKPNNTFPSDHFGLLADLALPAIKGNSR